MAAPTYYDYINAETYKTNPSTIHVENTGLNRFFERYLLQKAISVFEWKLPEHWDKDYFLYSLYTWGFVTVFKTDKYGVIPQHCGLQGYNIFYRPTMAVVSNPLITGLKTLKIGEDCTLLKLQPDYGGIMDLVSFYANMLALCAESAGCNLLNSKLAYVFSAKDKAQAESFKKMFDKIASGEPAVWVDKNLYNDDGSPAWDTFSNNLKENYIVPEILSDMRKWEAKFDTEIGIPNANTDKKERLITDEVNANNFETKSKCEIWLENLQKACEETNRMFASDDVNISVDWRKSLQEPKNCLLGGDFNGKE